MSWRRSSAVARLAVMLVVVAEASAQTPGRQKTVPASAATSSAAQAIEPAKAAVTGDITYSRDIAPIIFKYCVACHRLGEAGPFPLITYQDAKSHARQIAAVTAKRYMPPWLPEPSELKFAEELRLSEEQIATIQSWGKNGALEGNPAETPRLPKFYEGWQLGKPDVIVKAEKPLQLPANGIDTYWNFIFRAPVAGDRWISAVEIRPGDKRAVHHANILVDRAQSARSMETQAGAGFAGMELKIESETFDPDSHFLFWKPGTVAAREPDGMALRMDKNTDLVLNTHLQPTGKPETISPSIGLYFTDKPATTFPMLLQIENDRALDIPAGEKNFVVTDRFTLPVGVDLLAIYPHAHYLGKDLLATATLPNGKLETLIHIAKWDLNWQAVYRYAAPVYLPAGTLITMRYVYDNSADNLANPNDPPKRVVAGNRSSDEMAHLWLQVVGREESGARIDARNILQEALATREVEKDPGDFSAQYNLGAMLQARGEIATAAEHYAAAVTIRDKDAAANNALGAALLALGNAERAIPYFLTAVEARPEYFDAHYNLGIALAGQGKFETAAEHFEIAIRLRPEDADAESNLGSALAESGRTQEAIQHYQRALEINPQHALAKENLEVLQNPATP